MSNITEMFKSMSLLSERISLGVARTENLDFDNMEFDRLTISRRLDNLTLDLETDTNITGLDDFFIVGDLFTIHYTSRTIQKCLLTHWRLSKVEPSFNTTKANLPPPYKMNNYLEYILVDAWYESNQQQ